MANDVIFRRIRGRLVPIKVKGQAAADKVGQTLRSAATKTSALASQATTKALGLFKSRPKFSTFTVPRGYASTAGSSAAGYGFQSAVSALPRQKATGSVKKASPGFEKYAPAGRQMADTRPLQSAARRGGGVSAFDSAVNAPLPWQRAREAHLTQPSRGYTSTVGAAASEARRNKKFDFNRVGSDFPRPQSPKAYQRFNRTGNIPASTMTAAVTERSRNKSYDFNRIGSPVQKGTGPKSGAWQRFSASRKKGRLSNMPSTMTAAVTESRRNKSFDFNRVGSATPRRLPLTMIDKSAPEFAGARFMNLGRGAAVANKRRSIFSLATGKRQLAAFARSPLGRKAGVAGLVLGVGAAAYSATRR